MRQILFRIPPWSDDGLPIYGFGAMMVIALYAGVWLAGRRAQKEGIAKETLWDLAIWLFFGGIVGARIVYMIQYSRPVTEFLKIWEGGLVFYGSAIGGVVGYLLGYYFVFRKRGVSSWQLADIVAPSVALGLGIGRFGCLLNGCCFGNVACVDCPAIHFPVHSPPWSWLAGARYQTSTGFTLQDNSIGPPTVGAVEPSSAAHEAGLQAGDVIAAIDDKEIKSSQELGSYVLREWKRGQTAMQLTVGRGGESITLPAFVPRALGLHPTQLYESISMFLLFILLIAFQPFRPRVGAVMVLLMLCYAVHRFLNEMLRNDTDPVGFDMTLSQNGSVLVLLAAMAMALWLWRKGARPEPTPAVA